MDKQQKLEYQRKIENYLAREHVYDLFEELTKQLVVKQPDDPISFLIDRLSTPQSTTSSIQQRRSSSLALPDSRFGNLRSRLQTTTSLPPYLLEICYENRYQRSNSWVRKLSLTSNTSPWCETRSLQRWSRDKCKQSKRKKRASFCRAIHEPGCKVWPCRGKELFLMHLLY
jgi:hypothetical protein